MDIGMLFLDRDGGNQTLLRIGRTVTSRYCFLFCSPGIYAWAEIGAWYFGGTALPGGINAWATEIRKLFFRAPTLKLRSEILGSAAIGWRAKNVSEIASPTRLSLV